MAIPTEIIWLISYLAWVLWVGLPAGLIAGQIIKLLKGCHRGLFLDLVVGVTITAAWVLYWRYTNHPLGGGINDFVVAVVGTTVFLFLIPPIRFVRYDVRSRLSKRVVLLVLASATALLLLSLGGAWSFVYWRALSTSAQESAKNAEPASIVERAQAVADLDMRAVFQPAYSVNVLDIWVQNPVEFWALFRGRDPGSLLLLAYAPTASDWNAKANQLKKSIVENGQHYPQFATISTDKPELFPIKGRGRGTFLLGKGVLEQSNAEYWEVVGQFQGRRGPSILILTLPTATFDENRLRSMIQSINTW